MIKRPPTKMVRVRARDLQELKRRAAAAQKGLPDMIAELIRARKRK